MRAFLAEEGGSVLAPGTQHKPELGLCKPILMMVLPVFSNTILFTFKEVTGS